MAAKKQEMVQLYIDLVNQIELSLSDATKSGIFADSEDYIEGIGLVPFSDQPLFTEKLTSVFSVSLHSPVQKGLPVLPETVKKHIYSESEKISAKEPNRSFETLFNLRTILIFRQIFLFLSHLNHLLHEGKSQKEAGKIMNSGLEDGNSASHRPHLDFVITSELNREINAYIEAAANLKKFKFQLPGAFPSITGINLFNILDEIDWKRIRKCEICNKYFWAKRMDAWTCGAKCSNILRQRKFNKNQRSREV